jgi:hypothetical protein
MFLASGPGLLRGLDEAAEEAEEGGGVTGLELLEGWREPRWKSRMRISSLTICVSAAVMTQVVGKFLAGVDFLFGGLEF